MWRQQVGERRDMIR